MLQTQIITKVTMFLYLRFFAVPRFSVYKHLSLNTRLSDFNVQRVSV
jgi:hypothetical protein